MRTVMYDTLMSLLKVLTPIIPHTTEELWGYVELEDKEQSIQLTDFPEVDEQANFAELRPKWAKIIAVRNEVLKALEEARNAKVIGKSLEAKISVYADSETVELLNDANVNFAQLSIVSQFIIAGSKESAPANSLSLEKTAIVVEKADGEKCDRCWTISETVGTEEKHPTLCKRCAEVVENYYV